MSEKRKHWQRVLRLGLASVLIFGSGFSANGIIIDLSLVEWLHAPQAEHVSQEDLHNLVASGQEDTAFEIAFELGDELFETKFNALDGVGANVGDGNRFTRVPRADLNGPEDWASHFPPRATGPNAQACNSCHNQPFDDGAGSAASNVHRDPLQSAHLGSFITRNTPHVFAPGAIQRLAEEMTDRLHAIRDATVSQVCTSGQPKTRRLRAKGIKFGKITVMPVQVDPCEVSIDTSQVEGIDDDLVVRPFQWKGVEPTIRSFNRDASHNELGMQSVEIVGDGVDGDFDGVVDELTVGDQTALAIYLAAQPRPTSTLELASLGLIDPPSLEQIESILIGRAVFHHVGCASCHRPSLKIADPIFSEPSQNPNYRDEIFPAGQDPVARFLDPHYPVTFDLTRDQPDNIVQGPGGVEVRLGSLRRDAQGRGIVELYSDLKRHDLGPGLAESIDEAATGASVWITKELWGVGSTDPYLHDGRATTLTEAILEHGGEADDSRARFEAVAPQYQADLIAFLENLVLLKLE